MRRRLLSLAFLLLAAPAWAQIDFRPASSPGAASSLTAGTTVVTSKTNCFGFADGSSLFQCDNTLAKLDNSGAGDGAVILLKSPSGGATTSNILAITGTQPSTLTAAFNAIRATITTAGSSAQNINGGNFTLSAGYTGGARTAAIQGSNAVAGTGTTPGTNGNHGAYLAATGTTAGVNVGAACQGANSSFGNFGCYGLATTSNSGYNIGLAGIAGNSSGTNTAGYFNLTTTGATPVTTAIQANNGTAAAPIAVFQDNGTTVDQIRDGGAIAGKDAVGGTDTDTAGGTLVIGSGFGTGTAAGGDLKIQRSPSVASGTTLQSAADAIYVRSQKKALTAATATPFALVSLAAGSGGVAGWTGGTVFYTLVADDGTNFQSRAGSVNFAVVNFGGTETCAVGTTTNEPVANSSGTTTLSFDTDTLLPTNGCDLRATATSSLTETTLALFWTIVLNGPGTVSAE